MLAAVMEDRQQRGLLETLMDGISYLKKTTGSVNAPSAFEGGTWGEDKPRGIDPDKEGDADDLVLESWASCVAKAKYSKSKDDYVHDAYGVTQINKRHGWRRRTGWIGLDCGEDSFFVSNTRRVVGIADGVGGWRATNIDPAEISNALMEQGKVLSEQERDLTNPLEILDRSFKSVVESGTVRGGSTTALIATIDSADNSQAAEGKAKATLNVANLGDSGLLVWRKNRIAYRATELQHRFNAPYQLAILPRKVKNGEAISDPPSKSFIDKVPLLEDDIVVLGTDGLFDNVPNSELSEQCDLVLNSTGDYGNYLTPWGKWQRNTKSRLYAKDVVNDMVKAATVNAKSKHFMTPFSYALLEHGAASVEEALGGKPDDITIVLARVVRRKNWRESKGYGDGDAGTMRDLGGKFAGYVNKPTPG